MKKLIAILLLLAIALSLWACSGKDDPNSLHIGFSKVNITPDFLVELGSDDYSALRTNTDGVDEDIYLTCIAAKEGEERILFFTMDTLRIDNARADIFREVITSATGIPGDKIFFGATHSQYCPVDDAYDEFVKDLFVQAAQAAIEDLTPSTIYAASTQAENMTFHSHYIMSDGSYAGPNFGDWTLDTAAHVGEADQELQVVKFDRTGEDVKDVVLVNFQTHNVHNIGANIISPGHAGALRDALEDLSGCHVAYFTGASGNLSPSSKLEEQSYSLDDWRGYGKRLGEIAWDAMQNMESIGGTGIAATTTMSVVEVDHDWDDLLPDAKQAVQMGTILGGKAGDAYAVSYGFHSTIHANTIVTRAAMADIDHLYQAAFRIHDLGFIVATYEMFSENGVSVKDRSPYKYTIIFSGNHDHVPSLDTFIYQSFEGDVTYYIAGTAEQLQADFLLLLQTIQ